MRTLTNAEFPLGASDIWAALDAIADEISTRHPNRVTIVGIADGAVMLMERLQKNFEHKVKTVREVGEREVEVEETDSKGKVKKVKKKVKIHGRPHPTMTLINAKSYVNEKSQGRVKISNMPSVHMIRKQHIILLDDIIETGGTVQTVANVLLQQGAKSVTIGALLLKRDAVPSWADEALIGFKVPTDAFVVGYGMDFNGHFRDLPMIRPITEEEREAGTISGGTGGVPPMRLPPPPTPSEGSTKSGWQQHLENFAPK